MEEEKQMKILFKNEVYDLELAGMRKSLHQSIENIDVEITDEVLNELEQIHSLISGKDVVGLIDGYFEHTEHLFLLVEEDDLLEDALRIAGYTVDTSKASKSLYAINDDGVEVRISNHKRPAVEQNGIWVNHEYEKEIIVDENIVYLNQLKEHGFSRLSKPEYIL